MGFIPPNPSAAHDWRNLRANRGYQGLVLLHQDNLKGFSSLCCQQGILEDPLTFSLSHFCSNDFSLLAVEIQTILTDASHGLRVPARNHDACR